MLWEVFPLIAKVMLRQFPRTENWTVNGCVSMLYNVHVGFTTSTVRWNMTISIIFVDYHLMKLFNMNMVLELYLIISSLEGFVKKGIWCKILHIVLLHGYVLSMWLLEVNWCHECHHRPNLIRIRCSWWDNLIVSIMIVLDGPCHVIFPNYSSIFLFFFFQLIHVKEELPVLPKFSSEFQ